MSLGHWVAQGLFALLIGLVMTPHAQAGVRDDLKKLQAQLQRVATNIGFLERSFRKINLSGRVSLSKRLADGQINFLLKDYLRASILLLDAVENPKNKGRMGWYDATYILAESLYKNRNIQGATKYYRILVEAGKRYAQESLVRLMEIASKTGKRSWLNSFFQRAQRLPTGELRNKIYYLRAKGLYKLRQFGESQRLFQQISSTPKYGSRSKYFLAVLTLQSNLSKPDLKAARNLLQQALANTPKTKANTKLRDIILLSLGRLHMEGQDIAKALRYYQRIGRKSHVFDQALYEICWAYIRRGNKLKKRVEKQREFNRALRALDLLLAFLPQSPFYPRAQLLKGNLQLQLAPFKKGKAQERLFNRAMNSYQKIAKRYRTVYQEMEQITKNRARPIELFEQLISQQLDQFSVAKILPQDAIRWMSDEELMGRTLQVLKDLREMQVQLKSARQIVTRLESALQVRESYALSPTLRDARLRSTSMKSKLTELSRNLNGMRRKVLGPHLSASEREQLLRLQQQLKAMRYMFLQTPKNKKELLNRSNTVRYRIDKMNNRLHNITIQLAYSTRALRSIRRWLETSEEARKLTPSQRSSIETNVRQYARQLTTLQKEKANLISKLDLARIQLGYASAAPQERRIQNRYSELLRQEQDFLNRIKARLSSSDQSTIDEIRSAANQLESQRTKVKGFFRLIAQLSDKYARRVSGLINIEKLKLNQYEQQIFQLKLGSKRLASRIAFNTFLTVRKKFRDLVLKAEVGVIDVAWQEKQTIRNEVTRLSKERNSELRVLDSEFRDLVQEVK